MFNRNLLILGLLFVCGVAVWGGGGRSEHKAFSVSATTSNSSDVAKVYRISEFTGRDSFDYVDSIAVQTGLPSDSSYSVITWLSPLQVSRITLQTLDGRPNAIDTTIVYSCSLDAGTNKYGFAWSAPETGDDTLLSTAIDVLVDSINNTAGIKDTVVAHDSVTYVKLISLFAMDNLEGAARWTLDLDDSLTEGQRDSADIEMVCDSMVALINADSIGGYVTAANLDDTAYTVTSDLPGRVFIVEPTDTAQDTTVQTANVTSWSSNGDTIPLDYLIDRNHTFRGVYARFILSPSLTTSSGLGLADSGIFNLTTSFMDVHRSIGTNRTEGLPCTLYVKFPSDSSSADTVMLEHLHIAYIIKDSLTAEAVTASYRIQADYMLTER